LYTVSSCKILFLNWVNSKLRVSDLGLRKSKPSWPHCILLGHLIKIPVGLLKKIVGKINLSDPKGCFWKYMDCCALPASKVLVLTLALHEESLLKPLPTLLIMWLLKKRNPALFLCFQPTILFKNLFGLLYLKLTWQGTYVNILIIWKIGASVCVCKERRK